MENKESSNNSWWQPGVILFFRLSGWIGGPIIIAVFIGKWLDKKYNSDPWLFLLTVGVAFVVSMVGVVKDSVQAMKEIERKEKEKKDSIKI